MVPTINTAFLIWPRIPDTVFSLEPSNFATSKAVLNIPLMKAVFLKVFVGVPTNFSFLTMLTDALISNAVPVKAIRNPAVDLSKIKKIVNISGSALGTRISTYLFSGTPKFLCLEEPVVRRMSTYSACVLEYTSSIVSAPNRPPSHTQVSTKTQLKFSLKTKEICRGNLEWQST